MFPTLKNSPKGVLSGFRIAAVSSRIAKPLQRDEGPGSDARDFCYSLLQWATYFSVPITRVKYLLIDDATDLLFDCNRWTTNGHEVLRLGYDALRNGCKTYEGSAWP